MAPDRGAGRHGAGRGRRRERTPPASARGAGGSSHRRRASGWLSARFTWRLPTLTGGLTGKPGHDPAHSLRRLVTIKTQSYLPAVATGMAWTWAALIVGMVLPFFAMVGSFVGLFMTMVANPILYHAGVLLFLAARRRHGHHAVQEQHGLLLQLRHRHLRGHRHRRHHAGGPQPCLRSAPRAERPPGARSASDIPKGRGDIPHLDRHRTCYTLLTLCLHPRLRLADRLEPRRHGRAALFGFLYTPLIGYVTARLEGMAGQVGRNPDGARGRRSSSRATRGVKVWFLPIAAASMSQVSGKTVFYRQAELTGTRFWSHLEDRSAAGPGGAGRLDPLLQLHLEPGADPRPGVPLRPEDVGALRRPTSA